MKYSEQVATATGEYRDSLPATLFDHKLKVLTVELQGGMFHGSGVLYQVTGDLVWVLTAAHNLHVWAEDEMQSKHEDLADDFIEEVKVRILPRHKAARDYPIESIKLHDGNAKCGYDVCAVSIRSDALAGDVRQLLENNTGGPFRLGDTDGDATSTLLLKADVSDWVASQNQLGNYAIVQFGYGKDGSDKYHRHWRALKWQDLKNAATKPAYLQSAKEKGNQTYLDVLTFASSDDTSTTTPGDSGGPAFLIEKAQNYFHVRLLGLTLGANYFGNRVAGDNEATSNNAITVLSQERLNVVFG